MTSYRWMIDNSSEWKSRYGKRASDFLNGLAAKQKQDDVMDVTEELKELWYAYTQTFGELKDQEAGLLANLIFNMKQFIEVYEQRKAIETKMSNLSAKLKQEDEGEDDDE